MTEPVQALPQSGPDTPVAPPRVREVAAFQVALNVLSSYGLLAVTTASGIFLTPLLLHALGPTNFGLLRLSDAIFGYVGLFDFGVSASVLYFVARYRSQHAQTELNEFASTIFLAATGLGAIVFSTSVLAAPALVRLFAIPAESVNTAEWVIRISAIQFSFNLMGRLFVGVLRGSARYDIVNAITAGLVGVNTLGTFILLRLGYDLLAVVTLGAVLACAAMLTRVTAVSILRLCTISIGRARRFLLKKAFDYGLWSFLTNIASQLAFATTDVLIVSYFLGVASVATYSVAAAPAAFASGLVFQAVDVFQPTLTTIAYRRGEGTIGISGAFLLLTKVSILIGWGLVLMICLAGKQFLDLWVGNVGSEAARLLVVLAFAFGFNYVGHVCALVLLGVARHKVLAMVALADSSLNVLLSIVGVQRFGLIGVGLGTIIALGINDLIVLPVYVCRVVGLRVTGYLTVIGRSVVLFAGALGTAWLVAVGAGLGTSNAYVTVAGQCLAAGAVFAIGSWFGVFARGERVLVLDAARSLLRRK